MALFWLRLKLMQKLYWPFLWFHFIFLQTYNIWQILAMGHGYQVPVDKHDSDETFNPPTPRTP